MPVHVRLYTDPACPWSWSAEPVVRKLMVEFAGELSWTYVMGGLERDYRSGGAAAAGRHAHAALVEQWLAVADDSRMPVDPRLWSEGPIASTYPACMAVKAAAEQAPDRGYAYLRALREGLMCFRRKLDTTEALVEEARRVRLDVERFRIDLGSHATVEAFGADLEETRSTPDEAEVRVEAGAKGEAPDGRLPFPTLSFRSDEGERRWVLGPAPYPVCREAAEAAGATPSGEPLGVLEALQRFGRLAEPEIEAICELPTPRAAAELWGLASDWKAKPVRVLTGHLWEPA